MNSESITKDDLNRFDTAVRNYTPAPAHKFRKLIPFKDGIAELRRKGATYGNVTDILRAANVTVTVDTVARFCREVLRAPRRNGNRGFAGKKLQAGRSAPDTPAADQPSERRQ